MKWLLLILLCLDVSQLLAQQDFAYHQAITQGYKDLRDYKLTAAKDDFRKASAFATNLRNQRFLANALYGLGRVLYYVSDFDAAADTISRSVLLFKRLHQYRAVAEVQMILANIYQDQGDYEKAFEACNQIDAVGSDIEMQKQTQLGNLYTSIEDYPTALTYYNKALAIPGMRGEYAYRELNHRLAELYAIQRKFDSARHFYKEALVGNPNSLTVKLGLGKYFNLRGQYDSALSFLLPIYKITDTSGEGNIRIAALNEIGLAYAGKHSFVQALGYAKRGYDLAAEKGGRQFMRDATLLLSDLYDSLNDKDLAYAYYKQYVLIKDSLINDQLRGKLYAFKYAEASEKRLSEAADTRRIWVSSLIFVIIIILFLFFYRSLRHSNETLALKRRAADLEMQALRTQMNPHFIFNALSSINGFILNNQPTEAADYLARFSRLVRLVLELSSKPAILLQDEIQILRLYLEMESLRFRNKFTWKLCYQADLDNLLVPPLIFQPFCENAIWHGLLHKDSPGSLTIEFSKERDTLNCIITDDGVGRAMASTVARPGKERGLGLNITGERLSLFNQSTYEIEDLETGTRVTIKIKLHA